MPGMPGRSGGTNRLTVEQHQVRGTFRADRHASALARWTRHKDSPAPSDGAEGWKPSASELAGLGEAGRRFVRGWLKTYSITRAEGAVLMQAAVAQDRLTELRSRDRSVMSAREDGMVQRLELNWLKLLAGLLAQLRIQR
jgi:hypothetical protein